MHYFLEASYPEAHSLKEDQPHRCGRARSLCEGERHAFVTRPIREHARRPQSQGRGPHGLGRGHGGAKGPQLSAGGSSPFGRDGEARAERKRKAKGAARGPCLVLVALVLFGAVRGAWLDRRVPHFDLGVERYLRRLAPRAAPISAKSRAHQRQEPRPSARGGEPPARRRRRWRGRAGARSRDPRIFEPLEPLASARCSSGPADRRLAAAAASPAARRRRRRRRRARKAPRRARGPRASRGPS